MPGDLNRARDPDLLDALEALPRSSFEGTVWRVVREGRSPIQAARVGGRWDIGGKSDSFDVLYTSLDRNGAIAEVEYHLNKEQPVFPSKIRSSVYEIRVQAKSVIKLESLSELILLGVSPEKYHEPLYGRTQEIGDAAAFLGCDGLIVPNARWPCLNLVIFPNALTTSLEPSENGSLIKWQEWRARHRSPTRRLQSS